jgi:hypothetical protein
VFDAIGGKWLLSPERSKLSTWLRVFCSMLAILRSWKIRAIQVRGLHSELWVPN